MQLKLYGKTVSGSFWRITRNINIMYGQNAQLLEVKKYGTYVLRSKWLTA